jgi:hypothetical protein
MATARPAPVLASVSSVPALSPKVSTAKILLSGTVAVTLLWATFRAVDFAEVAALVLTAGPLLLLPLAGYLVPLSVDTVALQRILSRLGQRIGFGALLSVRLSAEAVQLSLPGGSVLSESITPPLLHARGGVPLPQGLAAVAARKCFFGFTQSFFLVLALLFAQPMITAAAHHVRFAELVPAFAVSAAALFAVSSTAMGLLARGSLGERLRRALAALPSHAFRGFLDRRHAGIGRFDRDVSDLLQPRRIASLAPPVLLIWFAEAFETWLGLWLLGLPLTFADAVAIEAGVSILRLLGAAIPAALGVQEIGYVAFVAAAGAPAALTLTAAFSVLKRSKEAFWMLVGYSFFARTWPQASANEPAA